MQPIRVSEINAFKRTLYSARQNPDSAKIETITKKISAILRRYPGRGNVHFDCLKQLRTLLGDSLDNNSRLIDEPKRMIVDMHAKIKAQADFVEQGLAQELTRARARMQPVKERLAINLVNVINWQDTLSWESEHRIRLTYELRALLHREDDKKTKILSEDMIKILTHRDASGTTLLHLLVEHRCYSQFSSCVAICAGSELLAAVVDKQGNTLLHTAAWNNDEFFLEDLLDYSMSEVVNKSNINRDTPLHVALRRNCYDAASFLLRKGADYSILSPGGRHPLLMVLSEYDHVWQFISPWSSAKAQCAAQFILAGCGFTPLQQAGANIELTVIERDHINIAVLYYHKRYTVHYDKSKSWQVVRAEQSRARESIIRHFDRLWNNNENTLAKAYSLIPEGQEMAFLFELAVITQFKNFKHYAAAKKRLMNCLTTLYQFRAVHAIIAICQLLNLSWIDAYSKMHETELHLSLAPADFGMSFSCRVLRQYFGHGVKFKHNEILTKLFQVYINDKIIPSRATGVAGEPAYVSATSSEYDLMELRSHDPLDDWLLLLETVLADPSFHKAGQRIWKITPATINALHSILGQETESMAKLAAIKQLIENKISDNDKVAQFYSTIANQVQQLAEFYVDELQALATTQSFAEGACVEMKPLVSFRSHGSST
tara:strand:- start:27687 stop:29666 length:1980 start_codon:yes stop_codon:yes gene_type:complete